jgi:O-antigen/teichoic acid export membrane protein
MESYRRRFQQIATRSRAVEAGDGAFPAGIRPVAAALRGFRPGLIAIVDQALLSGMNFCTTVIVGRACGVGDLGIYSLIFGALVLVTAISESLLTAPFATLHRKLPKDELPYFAGLIFAAQLIACALTLFCFGGLAIASTLAGSPHATALAGAAAAIALVLMREFVRRYQFANLAPGGALAMDAVTLGLQLAILFLGWRATGLNLWQVYLAIVIANLAGLLVWALGRRPELRLTWTASVSFLRMTLATGVTNSAALGTLLIQLYIVPWTLAVLADQQAIGLFAACQTIVMLLNPLTQGLANHLMPSASKVYHEGGITSLLRQMGRYALLLGGLSIGYCVVMTLAAHTLLDLVFGAAYAGYGATLVVLAIAMAVRTTAMTGYIGLWVEGRSLSNAAANALSIVVTVLATVLLFPAFGLLGAAIALLVGDALGALARTALFVLTRPRVQPR